MVRKILVALGRPFYKIGELAVKKMRVIHWPRVRKSKPITNKIIFPKKHLRLPKIKVGLTFPKIKLRLSPNNKLIFLSLILLALSFSGAGWWFYQEVLKDLPNINEIYNPPKMSTKIYDRNGILLYKFYKDEDRSWVPISKIPKFLIEATLAVEDKDFYQHRGLSIKGILQATWHNFNNGENGLRGGSTITQQLVKNVFLSGEKTWRRKFKEAILALMVEKKLTKQEILERYFNQVAYGGETYGVAEAAMKYFGKEVDKINLAEATFLAGLPAAPSSYLPSSNNLSLAYERQKQVIEQMLLSGTIDKKNAEDILNNKVKVVAENREIRAPHFVFYVRDYLKEKLGFDNIERRGLKVVTSLDMLTQDLAQNIVTEEVNKVKRLRISNGAALVVNSINGDILAMVGSKGYFAADIEGKYNVTTALRQPGSSIKPINYLLALQNGKSLTSIIDDSPITYYVKGQPPYTPQNYTGKSLGKITLKTALASSLNIASVKTLNENGVDNMIDLAEIMGITSWKDRSRFGLSLALGSGEVKMTELAEAYTTFSQLGERVELNPILEVENYLGEKVYQKKTEKIEVTQAKYAYLIDSALSDDNARAPIFGLGSKLKIPGKTVAVKTGTTNNLKDNWCIGWTPEVMVAAWVGNNDGTPMSWVASGISGATPIWNRIMTTLLKDKKDVPWPIPTGVYKANFCDGSEYFTDGRERSVTCAPTPTPTPGP
jgi:membrane peptidoglycan carboxypeptidase